MDSLTVDIKTIFGAVAKVATPLSNSEQTFNTPLESELFWLIATIVVFIWYVGSISLIKSPFAQLSDIIFRKDIKELAHEEFSFPLTLAINLSYYVASPILIGLALATFVSPSQSPLMQQLSALAVGIVAYYITMAYRHLILSSIRFLSDKIIALEGTLLCAKLLGLFLTHTLAPLLLIFALYPHGNLFIIILASIAMLFGIVRYIIMLYNYFNAKKVSFLQYILYLCTVEIAPISFFIIFFRNNIAPLL